MSRLATIVLLALIFMAVLYLETLLMSHSAGPL
jgi:hypothetical protein